MSAAPGAGPPPAGPLPGTLKGVITVLGPFAGGYVLSYLFRSVNAVVAPDLVEDMGLGAADSNRQDWTRRGPKRSRAKPRGSWAAAKVRK